MQMSRVRVTNCSFMKILETKRYVGACVSFFQMNEREGRAFDVQIRNFDRRIPAKIDVISGEVLGVSTIERYNS